jgi:hypothetical protein
MQEKIKIRSNLSNHDLKHIELSSDMMEKLEELITQKNCMHLYSNRI